jgi:dipeptidyl aminopeptidase/acylaminoacyl peptidase
MMGWLDMEWIGRAVWTLGIVTIGLFLIAGLGLVASLHPMRYTSSTTPADLGWDYERISFPTRDGLTIKGWYIPRAGGSEPRNVIMVLHGYPYSKENMLGATPYLHEQYDLLLFDFRYFGESDGSMTTLGYREYLDVLAAVDYLAAGGTTAIGVWGNSMGAAVGMLALPHTDHIKAVVADSPFSDLNAMTVDYYLALPVLSSMMAVITDLLSRLFIGTSTASVSPADAVRGTQVPILLIHGAADSTIRIGHFDRTREALAASPQAEFWLVEGVDHSLAYSRRPDAYQSRVLDFFARHLK